MIALAGSTAEISPVERFRRPPVHEEDFVVGDDVTALPDRQRSVLAVVFARLADRISSTMRASWFCKPPAQATPVRASAGECRAGGNGGFRGMLRVALAA